MLFRSQAEPGGATSWAYLHAMASDYSSYSYFYGDAQGNPTNAAIGFSNNDVGSFSLSQFTSNGFSLTRSPTQATHNTAIIDQYFLVTGAVNFSLAAELWGNTSVWLAHYNANHEIVGDSIYFYSMGSINVSGTLSPGAVGDYYQFSFQMNNRWANGNETLFNLSFTEVPAPGAMALLGLAGLAGRRRRRS